MAIHDEYKPYGNETIRILNAMEEGRILESSETRCVFYTDDPAKAQTVMIIPSYVVVEERVYSAQKPGETRKQYAERLNHHPPQLSQYCSIREPRKLHQDTVVQIVLQYERVPSVSDVEHILMELNQPQLSLNTCDNDRNQRNLVIRRVLERAAAETEAGAPQRDWFALLSGTLIYLGLPKPRHGVAVKLSEEDRLWAESLKPELAQLTPCDYTLYRRELLEKYGNDIASTYNAVFQHIRNRMLADDPEGALTQELINTCFANRMDKQRNRLARTPLIRIFTALGCDVDEINRVLREANHPILYPRYGDAEERELCRRAARNSH